MDPVFVDTSFFLALWNNRDQHHEAAESLMKGWNRPMLTTRWVLAETGNAVCKMSQRAEFKPFVQELEASAHARILPSDEDSFHQALDFYSNRPDKEWSFVDCTSFVIMSRLCLTDALTTDHHFEQAGFNALLR